MKTKSENSEPKNHETRIRMSDKDIERLEYCCEALQMTKADIIRRGISVIYNCIKK